MRCTMQMRFDFINGKTQIETAKNTRRHDGDGSGYRIIMRLDLTSGNMPIETPPPLDSKSSPVLERSLDGLKTP